MLDEQKLQDRLSRILDSSQSMLGANVGSLMDYLRSSVVPTNHVLVKLDGDLPRWANWDPDPRRKGRKIPDSHDDRVSLAWSLFTELSKMKDDAWKLPYVMYLQPTLADNIHRFMQDWAAYFGEALELVRSADAPGANDGREKQQKFGILDAPNQLSVDLQRAAGMFGRVLIYFDLDNFKAINTTLTETVVDREVLPPVQCVIRDAAQSLGFAYAEGGDEFVVYLPNATLEIGVAFSESVRRTFELLKLEGSASSISIRASFGVAHGIASEDVATLKEKANKAKQFAKQQGKNCVAEWGDDGPRIAGSRATGTSALRGQLSYDNRGIA